jgi:uncharacterized protein (TIGR02594 family)
MITNEFNWFIGVVEDINDPKQLNRARVRVFGVHTDNKAMIATGDLPWATVMMSTNTSGMSGFVTMPLVLLQGSWVIGFFKDGKSCQDPVIMGTIASTIDTKPVSTKGFADPTGTYPLSDYLGQSDVHKMARGENTYSYTTDSVTGEPASPYAAKYPYNKVHATTSGHIIEIDDTPSAERIRVIHKSGTFVEIHPNGDIVHRNGNKWQVTSGNDKTHITGNIFIQVDGNADIKVAGNTKVDTTGRCRIASGGNMALIAPRIDLNPPGAKVGTVNPKLVDLSISFTKNIVLANNIEGLPANPEQVERTATGEVPEYTRKSPPTCEDGNNANPFDVAYQAWELGEDAWKENGSNALITALWDEIGYNGSAYADETAWCAVFVGAVLKRSGLKYIQTASSLAYESYGDSLESIQDLRAGDLVIFYRDGVESGKGHIGFATGRYTDSTIEVLGGNQGNTLSIRSFKRYDQRNNWGIKKIISPVLCSDDNATQPDSTYDIESIIETVVT